MNLPISKAMAIHIGCEVLLVGTISVLLSRRISSTQSDLNECALRIVAQGKQITELEERIADLEDMVKRLATRSLAASAAPSAQPFPFPIPPFQSFPVPVPAAPSRPASDATPDKPILVPADKPSPVPSPGDKPAAPQQSDDLDREIASELQELDSTSS